MKLVYFNNFPKMFKITVDEWLLYVYCIAVLKLSKVSQYMCKEHRLAFIFFFYDNITHLFSEIHGYY